MRGEFKSGALKRQVTSYFANSGEIAVISILSHYEPFGNEIVIRQHTLSPESALELLPLIYDSKLKALQPAEPGTKNWPDK
jgi:hypothetical protein